MLFFREGYDMLYTSTNQGYKLVGGAMCEMKQNFCCLLVTVESAWALSPSSFRLGYGGLLIIHLILCVKPYYSSECPCSLGLTSSTCMCTTAKFHALPHCHHYPLSVLNVWNVLNAVSIARDHHVEPWLLLLLVPFPLLLTPCWLYHGFTMCVLWTPSGTSLSMWTLLPHPFEAQSYTGFCRILATLH